MRNYTRLTVQQPDLAWFTADLHFNHSNIIRHCQRPFMDAPE